MKSDIKDHNSFYLTEDRRSQPKEYFKFLEQLAASRLERESTRVVDIGCATGDFLWFLRSRWPELCLTGMDVSQEFLDAAKERIPDTNFLCADLNSRDDLPQRQWDIAFMAGLHYLFPDTRRWLSNVLSILRPGGTAYVFGLFNPEPLDVISSIRRPGHPSSSTPYVLISKETVGLILDSIQSANHPSYQFFDWEMPFQIERTKDDPMRSWTIRADDGHYLTVNGTQMLQRFSALEITL